MNTEPTDTGLTTACLPPKQAMPNVLIGDDDPTVGNPMAAWLTFAHAASTVCGTG